MHPTIDVLISCGRDATARVCIENVFMSPHSLIWTIIFPAKCRSFQPLFDVDNYYEKLNYMRN
jgi:hypothetical protein